jgi:hypothetical protein
LRRALRFILSFISNPVLQLISVVVGKPMRIVSLPVERIGHLVMNNELYLREKFNGDYDEYFDIAIIRYVERANEFFINMIKREITVIDSRQSLFHRFIVFFLDSAYKNFGFKYHMSSNEYDQTTNLPQVIALTDAEQKKGYEELSQMGVPEGSWWVCLNTRNERFLKKEFPNVDLSYHSYRNCEVSNYFEAASEIVNRGGYVIRMGTETEEPLPLDLHPHIIDYATKFRTEFMDIFLSANCRFFMEFLNQLSLDVFLGNIWKDKLVPYLLHNYYDAL